MKHPLNSGTRILIMIFSLAILVLPALLLKDRLVETCIVFFRYAKELFLNG